MFQSRLKWLSCAAVVAASIAGAVPAIAQTFPSKPVTIVVPYAAGAAPDLVVRLLAPKLSASLGQPVVVENRAGAAGNIGGAYVAKAPPDGYTILLATQPMVTINPHLFKNMGYDPAKDLTPLATAVNVVLALSVNSSVPANNMAELIAWLKKNPGTAYGTSGVGTPMHLAGLRLGRVAGVELIHVPYRGGMLVLNDVIAGTLKMGFADLASTKALADTGKLRIIAIGEKARFSGASDIPTIGETVPGFDLTSWFGFFGPGSLPPAVTQRWSAELRRALQDPGLSARLHGMGIITRPEDSAELGRLVKSEYESFGRIVQDNKITID